MSRSTAEHMLYLLYTSGTTAKPKGIMHTTAGYLLGTSYTHEMVFDLKPDDVYWCAADVGWVTGHSYIVYGPLANATTGILYEGTPDTPLGPLVADHRGVQGHDPVLRADRDPCPHEAGRPVGRGKHDLSTLRVLGSVGEPINPEAWLWYHENIGGGRAPIVDTWWQTETGMIMITPLPGVTTTKPGSATFPFPGIAADVIDATGNTVPLGGGGYLVLKRPGRRCCAASTATPSATRRPTGAASRGCTSPATVPSATRRATSGCWAASTT